MPPFVQSFDGADVHQVIEHFQNIPDMMEYILESRLYPFPSLNATLKSLYEAVETLPSDYQDIETYRRTITKIESVISTRVDYVNSLIDHLLGKETFDEPEFSLDDSPTKEIFSYIDLMKDVAYSPEINQGEYKEALRKFVKTLKFRFNEGLEIHKRLRSLEFEDIAPNHDRFPQSLLEEYKSFLEDALTMTRNHAPVTSTQIHQLKETLFKILEATSVRMLQSDRFQHRADHCRLIQAFEDAVLGVEADFGQKIVKRFADMPPEYIAEDKSTYVIRHNRKLATLLIDLVDDSALLEDLYRVLINLTTAEAEQLRKKQELAQTTLEQVQNFKHVKAAEAAEAVEMERFNSLDLPEKARELIKNSLYGLCEHVTVLSVDELRKYPIGILRSIEKVLRDLDQHRLKQSDIKNLQESPEYGDAVDRVNEALLTYNSTNDKHNFVDVYKESDYTMNGITYCVFNDLILRSIQNITEAYFVVDSTEQSISEGRLSELQVTIVERYKREWTRQNEIDQQIEQEVMEELAGELT